MTCIVSGGALNSLTHLCCRGEHQTALYSSATISRLSGKSPAALFGTGDLSGLGHYVSLYCDRSDMHQRDVRSRTYILWPGWAPPSVLPDQLADAGLFFTGQDDTVRCYSCRETFSAWKEGDVPLEVHRRRSPACPAVVMHAKPLPPSAPKVAASVEKRQSHASSRVAATATTVAPKLGTNCIV